MPKSAARSLFMIKYSRKSAFGAQMVGDNNFIVVVLLGCFEIGSVSFRFFPTASGEIDALLLFRKVADRDSSY